MGKIHCAKNRWPMEQKSSRVAATNREPDPRRSHTIKAKDAIIHQRQEHQLKYFTRKSEFNFPSSNSISSDRNEHATKKLKKVKTKKTKPRRDSWPKLNKNPGVNSRRSIARSTQMTPIRLLHQHSSEESYDNNVTSGITSEKLNPYALRQQIEGIMYMFTNANVTYEVIGRTASYIDILLLKITESKRDITKYFRANQNKYADDIPEKKVLFIVHGLNILGMSNMRCLINTRALATLMSYYLKYLDRFDIFFVPLANPDGYTFLMNSQNIWTKNISPQNECPGVFLDRNFDIGWNITDLSSCSQLYPGVKPFSEVETRAIRDIFHHYSYKIIGFFNVHAGSINNKVIKGDAVLYPNGYTDMQIDDDKYFDLKGEIEEAMKNSTFQNAAVQVATLHAWYGKVYGTSVDYATTIYGIPFALEMVMQTYSNREPKNKPSTQSIALNEIWRRVIDTTFTFIWKRTNNTEAD